jgi:hypothetical protein
MFMKWIPDGSDAGLEGDADATDLVVGDHCDFSGAPSSVRIRIIFSLRKFFFVKTV